MSIFSGLKSTYASWKFRRQLDRSINSVVARQALTGDFDLTALHPCEHEIAILLFHEPRVEEWRQTLRAVLNAADERKLSILHLGLPFLTVCNGVPGTPAPAGPARSLADFAVSTFPTAISALSGSVPGFSGFAGSENYANFGFFFDQALPQYRKLMNLDPGIHSTI